mgnify:FL=1
MTPDEFDIKRKAFNAECEEALKYKGEAYTRGTADRLANFKSVAKDVGLTPLQVWSVYFHKHLDAIHYWMITGKEGPEGVRENFKDARNYLDLGLALKEEFDNSKLVLGPGPGALIFSPDGAALPPWQLRGQTTTGGHIENR